MNSGRENKNNLNNLIGREREIERERERKEERVESQARCARDKSDILPLPSIPSHFANYLSLTESGVALTTFMPGSGREGVR